MERDTKEFITPIDSHKIVIKTWLTGGEKRQIDNSLFVNTEFNSQDLSNFKLKGESLQKAQDIALETIVVSINDNKDNILKTILDMRSEDFDFVVEQINLITKGDKLKKK